MSNKIYYADILQACQSLRDGNEGQDILALAETGKATHVGHDSAEGNAEAKGLVAETEANPVSPLLPLHLSPVFQPKCALSPLQLSPPSLSMQKAKPPPDVFSNHDDDEEDDTDLDPVKQPCKKRKLRRLLSDSCSDDDDSNSSSSDSDFSTSSSSSSDDKENKVPTKQLPPPPTPPPKRILPKRKQNVGAENVQNVDPLKTMKLVTPKEFQTEAFIKNVIDNISTPDHLSATEAAKVWTDAARRKLNGVSVTLSHKVNPLVNLLLEQKMEDKVEKNFVQIPSLPVDYKTTIQTYIRCFNAWVDASEHVSFKVTNKKLLGQICPKDMFILTFFVFATCQRTRNDNILQLGLVGASTSGKSTLFESVLMEGSHVTTNEQGVGRFNMGNKPVLMLHDIDIRDLVASRDTPKYKTLCRTEPTVAKIHGATINLGPVFIFYSSNRRLMSHTFDGTESDLPKLRWRSYSSQANEKGKKKVSNEDLAAIQNRFIECFVRHPPTLPVDLPNMGGFQRLHGVLGIMMRVIDIMDKHQLADFHSTIMVSYIMYGICNNANTYARIMGDEDSNKTMQNKIIQLIDRFIKSPEQRGNLKQRLILDEEVQEGGEDD